MTEAKAPNVGGRPRTTGRGATTRGASRVEVWLSSGERARYEAAAGRAEATLAEWLRSLAEREAPK